jgi:hypothetical protein
MTPTERTKYFNDTAERVAEQYGFKIVRSADANPRADSAAKRHEE